MRRGSVLPVAFLAMFATMVARLAVSPLVPAVIEEFAASTATVGLALTGMWAAFALMHLPSGLLSDSHGEGRVVTAAIALTAVGSLALALAPSLPLFAAAAVALGAGAGLYIPAATSLLTSLYEERGGALGLHTAGGPVAGLVAPVAATAVAARLGWRAGVAVGAAVALPVAGVLAWRIAPLSSGGSSRPIARAIGVLRRPEVAHTTVVASAGMFSWQAFVSFFPTFLVAGRGFGATRGSVVFSAVFVLSAVSLPLVGRLSDAVDRDLVLAGSFLASAVGLGLFVADASLVAGVVALGTGFSWGGVLQSRFMDILPPDDRVAGFGAARTVYVLLGSAGSVVTGTLAETHGWATAFGVVAALLVVAAAGLVAPRLRG